MLDEETAARFSTAAALAAGKRGITAGAPAGIDWRTNTLAGDEGPGANPVQNPRSTAEPSRGILRSSGSLGGTHAPEPKRAPEPHQAPAPASGTGPAPQPAHSALAGQAHPSGGNGSGDGVNNRHAEQVRVTLRAGDDGRVTTRISVVTLKEAAAGGSAANGVQGMDTDEAPPPPPPPPSWDPNPQAQAAAGEASTAVGGGPKLASLGSSLGGSLDWATIKVGWKLCRRTAVGTGRGSECCAFLCNLPQAGVSVVRLLTGEHVVAC